jgi:hypothetical protein
MPIEILNINVESTEINIKHSARGIGLQVIFEKLFTSTCLKIGITFA